jgi:glycosyltransferase involved in cell wall biosynthesis
MAAVLSLFGVDPRRIGGVEMFARELSRQLGERGLRSVLAFSSSPTAPVERFLSLPNVTIEIVPHCDRANPESLLGVGRLLRAHRPQVVHLHFVGFLGPYPWLARLLSASRVFFTDHSSNPEGHTAVRRAPWKRALAASITAPVTGVVSVSAYGQRSLLDTGVLAPHKSHLIYNGVDGRRANAAPGAGRAFRARHGIPDDRLVVLQVSWLIPEKGVSDLLEAARLALDQRRGLHFVLAGDGRCRAAYEAQAHRLGISEHVSFLGLVDDPLAEGLYDAADIVCQVSRWEEVFGWVIAEAMLAGRPVIGTRVGGIPELVVDGTTGFLVARRQPAEIADRILRLANDGGLRAWMGREGAVRCRTLFDLQQNVARLVELYGV